MKRQISPAPARPGRTAASISVGLAFLATIFFLLAPVYQGQTTTMAATPGGVIDAAPPRAGGTTLIDTGLFFLPSGIAMAVAAVQSARG